MLVPVELPVSLSALWSSDFLLNSQNLFIRKFTSLACLHLINFYKKNYILGNHMKHSLTLILQEHVADAHQLA